MLLSFHLGVTQNKVDTLTYLKLIDSEKIMGNNF
jgi:hypothetical protein